MYDRPMHNPADRTPEAARAAAEFYSDTVAEVANAVKNDPVVVVGMAQNPVVKKARANLDKAGVGFTFISHGSYLSEWRRRLSIKMWAGWPTFPMVFVRGVLIGGNQELEAAIAEGHLKEWLEGEEGPTRDA
ncbi:MAG: glutaredoxin [Alphaproteobacteria bacterium]|nr:glutaredoxin [Alphaproteobacteria bacterium]